MPGDRSTSTLRGPTLVPVLGAFDALMIVTGAVVGVGIFINPSEVAALLPSSPAILLAWVVGGLAAMMGGIACSKLGRRFPRAGGLYVYLREAYGPALAFLYGWTVLLAIFSGVCAAISLTFARYASVLLPALAGHERAVAAGLVAALALVNYRGLRTSRRVQNVLSVAKLAAIAMLALLALATGGGRAAPLAGPASGPGSFLLALFPVFMSYGGWYTLTFLAADVRRPERNLPLGIVGGLALVIALYALVNAAYLRVLTVDEIARSPAVAAEMAGRILGGRGAAVLAALVVVSAPGSVNVVILSGSRLYYAMARDGLFFAQAARLHPRYGSPAWSIATQALWSGVLLFSHTYGQLLQATMFGEWTFFTLIGAAVFVFAARDPGFYRSARERALIGASAAGFTAVAAAVVGNALVQAPGLTLVGVAVILAGLPVYAIWRARSTARVRGRGARVEHDGTRAVVEVDGIE
jgi:APA family basic amino acid/polyamine antiporter